MTVAQLPDNGGTQSFAGLVVEFQYAGLLTTPAQIAVANQTVTNIFHDKAILVINDYIIQPGDSLASIARSYVREQFTIDALAAAAKDSPNIFQDGVPLYLQVFKSLSPSQTTTLASLARLYGLSVEQLALFNALTKLHAGKTLLLANLVEINAGGRNAFAPYAVQASTSLHDVARKFGETNVLALCERNRTVRHIFQPNQSISVGRASITTRAEDSLNSLWSRIHAQDRQVDFAQMVAAIASITSLLEPGAFVICTLPTTPANAPTSLAALAVQFQLTPALIAQANSSLRYFVRSGVIVQANGKTLTTHIDETFNSLVERFQLEYELATSVTEIANQNAGIELINQDIIFLLPPRPVLSTVNLGANYPQAPVFPSTIFKLTTELIIQRNASLVAPDFQSTPGVKINSSVIAPRSTPAQEAKTLSLWNFALAAEYAFLDKIKLAVSGKADTGNGQVWVVNFGPGGITSVVVGNSEPGFFALPPLATKLIDASDVKIRRYNKLTGKLEPLVEAIKMNFQSVDLEVWAGIVLPAIDLILSPAYAVPTYAYDSTAFTTIVKVKDLLATSISQNLSNVLAKNNPNTNLADAQERLRQELLISLSRGYATDVLIQYSSTTHSPFTVAGTAPRLSGVPVSSVYQTGATDTLGTLALYYQVSEVSLAMLLGPVVRILNDTVSVTYNYQTYPIEADDALNTLMQTVGASSYQEFVDRLQAPQGLFAPATTLNLYKTQMQIETTSTFASIVEYFDAPLEMVVVQNQEREGIFKIGVEIQFSDYTGVTVTAQNNSLNRMAAQIAVVSNKPCSPLDLARGIETETGLLNTTFIVHVVRYVPELNLSSMKTSLANGTSTVNTLLNLKSRGKQKKLLLDLRYRINELEYDIYTQPDTGGYQASSWLSFIIPIGADQNQHQVISPQLGQIEIPLPLRSYPTAPLLLEQSSSSTFVRPTALEQAKGWTYDYSYQHQTAPQDIFYLASEFNLPSDTNTLSTPFSSLFFTNMAQFVSVYEEVKAKLTELLLPGTAGDEALKETLKTFAEMMRNIAETWPVNQVASTQEQVLKGTVSAAYTVPTSAYLDSATNELLLNTLTLTRPAPPVPPAPNGHFPNISWRLASEEVWQPLRRNTSSDTLLQCVYSFEQPAPAFASIEYRLASPATNVIDIQNANSRVQLTRNEHLVSTGNTDSKFVYRTAEIPFPNIIRPFVSHSNLIPFRQGSQSLSDALKNLFETILGSNPSAFSVRLSVLFGYDLVSSAQAEVDPIVSLLPILFQPTIPYSASFPGELATALNTWQISKPFSSTQGLYVLDLMVYSTLTSKNYVPVLELKRLYFDRALPANRIQQNHL